MSPDESFAERFESRLEFETLLSNLSSRFVHLPPGEVDSQIEESQGRVCEFLGVDRSVLWQWSMQIPRILTPTHVYVTPEIPGPVESPSHDNYPWLRQQMLAGRTVILSSPEELPAEARSSSTTAFATSAAFPLNGGPPARRVLAGAPAS